MLPALRPWEKITWTPEQEQILYRDWGVFYFLNQQLDKAAYFYNKSLDIYDDDAKALYYRSVCKRNIAQTSSALEDARAAVAFDPMKAPLNLEVCDAIYELNEFENCKIELHNKERLFTGNKVKAFKNRLTVLNENFGDSLGDSLGPFFLKNEKIFDIVLAEMKRERTVDKRPLWKILKAQGKCDVLSILEKEEILLSPREVARRFRGFKVFNQIYFNKSWHDVLFLRNMQKNPNLLLPQAKVSTPLLKDLTSTRYSIIFKFLKMLHARSPLYNEYARKGPRRDREAYFNRIQYQTRRTMNSVLRNVSFYRAAGKIEKLSSFIEEVMGDYVVLKTFRVMPWKLEFITEIYNTLALAHADRLTITNVMDGTAHQQLLRLLRLPLDKLGKDRNMTFVFGDKSTYQEPDAIDPKLIAYKKFLIRLDKRIRFAKYGVERCYLFHEVARRHLHQSRFDECCSAARKAIDVAKAAKCTLWQFLSVLQIVKSHAVMQKVERCREALDEALILANALKSQNLIEFIELCSHFNELELFEKKRTQSIESVRKFRGKSTESHMSMMTFESSTDINSVNSSDIAEDEEIQNDSGAVVSKNDGKGKTKPVSKEKKARKSATKR